MNSVRPLVTITILIVVGAYLYVKINQGPAHLHHGNEVWQDGSAEGVPPLDTAAGAQPAAGNPAPAWPPAASQSGATQVPATNSITPDTPIAATTTTTDAGSNAGLIPQTLPAVPAIPDLPPVETSGNTALPTTTAAVTSATATAAPTTTQPLPLPADIPTAHYPDEPGQSSAAVPSFGGAGIPPINQNSVATPTQPETATNAAAPSSQDPYASAILNQPAVGQNPLRSAPPSANEIAVNSNPNGQPPMAAGATAPVEPGFAESWPEIQTALDRGELARAHELLTKWYDDPSLTPADAQRVESLLGQLAGTVIYSTEHQLQPARVVKSGETLETIAQEYNVPWQLLAKINGVSAADQVRPGQELKVVPGPFSGVVDLNRHQLTLMVGGRYAGKFAVIVPPGTDLAAGEWVVQDKKVSPTEQQVAYPMPASSPQRSLILRRADATDANPGTPLVLGTAPPQTVGSLTQSPVTPTVELSSADAAEVTDILSVGSRLVIRR